MRLSDGFRLTSTAITSRPLRSLLTLLGVAIGIAAVTLLTAIGEGLRSYVLDSFSQFGTRIVSVHPGKTQTGGAGGLLGSLRPLTVADAESLRQLPHVNAVVPIIRGNADVQFNQLTRRSDVLGAGYQLAAAWRDWCARPEVTAMHSWTKAQRLIACGGGAHELFAVELEARHDLQSPVVCICLRLAVPAGAPLKK